MIELKCVVIMFKAHDNQLLANLQKQFTLVKDTELCSLRSQDKFKINYARTIRMTHFISSYGVKLCNSFPETLAHQKHVLSFKNKYIKLLLNQYL